MLANITTIKVGQYNNFYKPNINNQKQNKSSHFNIKNELNYPAIYFLGNIHNKTTRPPFKDNTLQTFNNMYDQYIQNLHQTTIEDISNVHNEIINTTNFQSNEILESMQLVTQFGNMDSLKIIGDELYKHDVGFIPYNGNTFLGYINNTPAEKALNNNFGLNAALYYLFEKKELQAIDGKNIGIFLDNNKLNDLEKLSDKELKYIQNKKNIKFFILSGYNNGVNFINRNKDLKQETVSLLNYAHKHNMPVKEAIDDKILKRCKKLNIEPIVIKNKKESTIENIHNQLKPNIINKKQLTAIIDAASMSTFENINKQVECKDGIVKYLDNTLQVYTPERLSKELKTINKKIEKQVQTIGKTIDDIIYIIPTAGKSYDLINYQYQDINNIPKEKFITLKDENSLKKIDTTNKVLVILDDCSLSGSSFLEDENFDYYTNSTKAKGNNSNIIFAAIYASDKAEDRINTAIIKRKRTNNDFIIKNNNEEVNWDNGIESPETIQYLNKALGDYGWKDSKYCIIFPYMSPDNNSEFAADIALFHNINYKENDNIFDNFIFSLSNIKTFFDYSQKVATKAAKLLMEDN